MATQRPLDPLIRFLFQCWDEFDHAIGGLSLEEATTRSHGGSAIAWTTGHAANTTYVMLNRPFLKWTRHALIGGPRFATGGSGDAVDWDAILAASREIRAAAREFLESGPDIEMTVPYTGRVEYLRQPGLSLRYALMSVASHHVLHAGEVLTLRSLLGKPAPEYEDWGRDLV